MTAKRSAHADVRVFADATAATRAAKDVVLDTARTAIAQNGRFRAALSGGSTPRALYASFGRDELPWDRVEIFFVDERCVPPAHAESNFRWVQETLLASVPIPSANVHRMRGEDPDPEQAAREYEAELRTAFAETGERAPRFDFVLLGLGADGHTASLFPSSRELAERERWVVAARVEPLAFPRITLTVPVLRRADATAFLVVGREKATAVAATLGSDGDPSLWPARLVAPTDGRSVWLLDGAAAAEIHRA